VLVLRREPEREDVRRALVRREHRARLERCGDQARCTDARARDDVRVRECFVDARGAAVPAHEDVVRRLLVQRSSRLRVARVDERRELLDLDDNELRGVRCQRRALGDDERDRLAHVAHAVAREHRMRDRHDVRAARHERERVGVEVGRRQHGTHPPRRERGRRVDPDDPRVRVEAARERGMQHPGQLHVVDELRLALQEALVLGARERTPDPAARPGDGAAHPAASGSKGTPCRHSAPSSRTIVSAPSWRPMRSSGVIGFGWMTIAMLRSNVRPGGGSSPLAQ